MKNVDTKWAYVPKRALFAILMTSCSFALGACGTWFPSDAYGAGNYAMIGPVVSPIIGPPQPATYVDVTVQASPGLRFLYVRTDHWSRLGSTNDERIVRLWREDRDRVVGAGAVLELSRGSQYYLIPICAGAPSWPDAVLYPVSGPSVASVTC